MLDRSTPLTIVGNTPTAETADRAVKLLGEKFPDHKFDKKITARSGRHQVEMAGQPKTMHQLEMMRELVETTR